MSKRYSIEFRERAVARVFAGESANSVATGLGVSLASILNWIQRKRSTGSVASAKMGGDRPRMLAGEHREWLLSRVKSDFTLRGLMAELAGRGVTVDYRTVWNFLNYEGISKKKRGRPPVMLARQRAGIKAKPADARPACVDVLQLIKNSS
jgi:putative transposase